jgi:heat shock protein HslJ
MKTKLIAIFLFSIFLISCKKEKNELEGTKWTFVSGVNAETLEVSAPIAIDEIELEIELTPYIIEFNEKDRYTMPNYCNYTTGQYILKKGSKEITINPFIPYTNLYCEYLGELEKYVQNNLENAETYTLVSNQLIIHCGGIDLYFEK